MARPWLHLDRGLYEAHARDEAGYEDEGGHRQMWWAARDIAFEDPVTEDETVRMLERLGCRARVLAAAVDPARLRAEAIANRSGPTTSSSSSSRSSSAWCGCC